MSLAVPKGALVRALRRFSPRELAYILYVLFEEEFERVVFVVHDDSKKVALEEFLSSVRAKLRKSVTVITSEEYRDAWRELTGALIS